MSYGNVARRMAAAAGEAVLDVGASTTGIEADVISESTAGSGVTIDPSSTGIKIVDAGIDAATAATLTLGAATATALTLGAADITTTVSGPMTISAAALTFNGGTGVNEIVVTNNVNDALSIECAGGDFIVCNSVSPYKVTITPATTVTGVLTSSGGIVFAAGQNIQTGTSTGTIIASAANQKLGFYGAAAVVQPTGIANATNDVDNLKAQLNSVIAALESLGLLATV